MRIEELDNQNRKDNKTVSHSFSLNLCFWFFDPFRIGIESLLKFRTLKCVVKPYNDGVE